MTPEMPPTRVWLLTLGVVTVLALLGQCLSFAQAVSEYQVKAAYLYNFAKFVEWPSRDFPSPRTLTVLRIERPSIRVHSESDRERKGCRKPPCKRCFSPKRRTIPQLPRLVYQLLPS